MLYTTLIDAIGSRRATICFSFVKAFQEILVITFNVINIIYGCIYTLREIHSLYINLLCKFLALPFKINEVIRDNEIMYTWWKPALIYYFQVFIKEELKIV